MPFVDMSAQSDLESLDAETVREKTHVGRDEHRSRLIAVAILSDMEKQGRTLAVVTRPYAYMHEIRGVNVAVEVPEGFVTDFASIPSFFHFLVQPFGRHAPAAVLHDYLYAIGQKKARPIADRLFLNAMREAGVGALRRSLMYRMVRFFGGRGYGLPDDWKFVDTEEGQDIEPPYSRDGFLWAPEKQKRGKKAAQELPTA